MPFNSGLFDDLFNDGAAFASDALPAVGDLGRFQLGDFVPLAVLTVDHTGFPTMPDAAPVATVADGSGTAVATLKLALLNVATQFGLPWFLGVGATLGTYTVQYAFTVAGHAGTATDTFEVIPGGDPGGAIISMFAFDRPEATYVVAQLTSGLLVQGRNPSF